MKMRATMKAALAAAILAGAMTLGGFAVQAQSTDPGAGQDVAASASCIDSGHEMTAMMRVHMGTQMMEPQGSPDPGMMSPDPGPGMGMVGRMSSRGMMDLPDPSCMAMMGQMVAMMREHMGGPPMATTPSTAPAPSMVPAPSTAPSPDAHETHHPDGSESVAPAEGGAAASQVDVTLTDALRIEPASMQVAVGEPVTFVVTNAGVLPHEFVVGDEAVQQEHETTMQGMGSMTHDEPNAIGLEPGETKELTMTFSEPGETLAGCHIPGHYPAGMWATITVTP